MSFPEQYSFSQNYFITHSGHRMHYLDEGSSNQESIVFLHGNPTWSFMYRNLISQLSNDYRCIAPDHIGCGLSEKPSLNEFSYDLEGHSANLFDLLEKLEVKHFSLVVHDWGGAIGLTAFRKEYQRVQKVVLLNTASFNSDDVPKRIQFCRIPLLGSLFVRAFNGFAWPASFMASAKGLTKTVRKGYLSPYNSWRNRIAVWRFVMDIPLEKSHPSRNLLTETENSLPQLTEKEVMACWGMKDFCFHPEFLKKWKEIIPSMQVFEYHDAGHYLLEDAGTPCIDRIKSFFCKNE